MAVFTTIPDTQKPKTKRKDHTGWGSICKCAHCPTKTKSIDDVEGPDDLHEDDVIMTIIEFMISTKRRTSIKLMTLMLMVIMTMTTFYAENDVT